MEWKRLETKYNWFDCTAGFFCSCGEEIVADVEDGIIDCDCGRQYRVCAHVEIAEPEENEDGNGRTG